MSLEFNNLVEEIKKLSRDEKEGLKFLIEKYLIEERRNEIFKNFEESLKELEEGKIEFSSDVKKLGVKHDLQGAAFKRN